MRSLGLGGSGWPHWGPHRRPDSGRGRQQRGPRKPAASGDALSSRGSYWDRVKGLQGPLKAAVVSGTTSAAGDLLAQFLTGQATKSGGGRAAPLDPLRTARMFGFGFFWYGPYQFYWYNLLDHLMPVKNTPNFLAKVTLNQLALAPVTLAAVFAWNLGLTGRMDELPAKVSGDLVPSMVNGWKFWVPAASLNFYVVPLQHQVVYMSCCGMLWTAYLSYISAQGTTQQQQQQQQRQPAAAARGKAK